MTTRLHIDADAATLARGEIIHPLPFGAQAIAALFHREPPAGHEIEQAIDRIEDALMQVAGPLRGTGPLVIDAGEWLAWSGGETLPLAAVEDRFQRLASAALGHPGALHGHPVDAALAAVLVVVREVMHPPCSDVATPAGGVAP
jgi:hypothetical protein